MSRRIILLIAVIGLAFLAWSITESDELDPCRSADNCVSSFTVQLDGLDLIDPEPARTALSARTSDGALVIALEGRRAESSERNDRIVVATVSAESGSLERIVFDQSGRAATVEGLVHSPDGTLIGVASTIVDDGGSVIRSVAVVDEATGTTISTAEVPELERGCLLAFAADNSLFTCSSVLYEVWSGDALSPAETVVPIELESRWIRAGFRTAVDVRADPISSGSQIRLEVDGEELVFSTASATIEDADRGEITFRPDGARLVHHRRSLAQGSAELVVYRTGDPGAVRRIQRSDAVHDVAWLGADQLVTITSDLDVTVYEID